MKNAAVIIFGILLIFILGLCFISFQVREIESAIVMRFGNPSKEITEPGLYFKLPTPVDKVYKFDSRMRVLEAQMGETTTKGAIPIIVNTYVVWRISEPLEFYNSNSRGSITEAEDKLRSQISDTQNRIIGRHSFGEFVNSNPEKINIKDIEEQIKNELQRAVAEAGYGVKIETLGIKQLKVSEDVSKSVFERMRAERNSQTQETISQGEALATKIRTDADAKKTELLAAAEARAKAIRAKGDAEAAKYYKMLEEDPEFAMFLRNIEALQKSLEKRTTYVVPTDVEPFELLKQMPELKQKDKESSDDGKG